METKKKHLINLSSKKIKHWIIEVMKEKHIISTGTDFNKLKTTTKLFKDDREARLKFTNEVWKKMGKGFIYKNENNSGKSGELLWHLRAPNNSESSFLDIHPNGKTLAIGSIKKGAKDAEIHLFDLESGLMTLLYSIKSVNNSQTFIHSVHFDSTGDKILFSLNTRVEILDLASKKAETFAEYQEAVNGPNPFCARPMFNTQRDRYLYFDSGNIKVCNETFELIFKRALNYSNNNTSECRLACISPSGKYLALYHVSRFIFYGHSKAKNDFTNRIDIWDIDKNKLVRSIRVEGLKLLQIKFNLAETEIVFTQGYAEGPGFFDITSGKLIYWFKDKFRTDRWYTCFDFAYSPCGKLLAVGKSLFDAVEYQKEIIRFVENNKRSYKLIFSPDSKLYIQGGDSGEIFIRHI